MNQFFSFARRVKEYTRLVGKYVTSRRKRFRPHYAEGSVSVGEHTSELQVNIRSRMPSSA